MRPRNVLQSLLLSLVVASVLQAQPTDYIGYWPFNGNANDESSYGNDGFASQAVLTTDRFDEANHAYAFDGTDDYIHIDHATSLDLTGNEITLSLWVKPIIAGGMDGSSGCILSKNDGSRQGGGYALYFNDKGGDNAPLNGIKFMLSTGSGWIGGFYGIQSNDNVISDNEWQHIVGVYDGSTLEIFVNGTQACAGSGSANIGSNTYNLTIGTNSVNNYDFHGSVDDVRIYDHALSETEITDLYNASAPDGGTTTVNEETVWSASGDDIYFNTGHVAIGRTTIPTGYSLAVDGNIRAREVKIDLETWSDFVFEDHYRLRTLPELDDYIHENKHLPDVPSEEQVTKEGVSVGEMNKILLQKIEELTLYIIEQDKQLKEQNRLLREQNIQLQDQDKRIKELEQNEQK